MTRRNADAGLMTPEGISRISVLVFSASIWRSTYLLKAIAALLAKTIQSRIRRNNSQLIDAPSAARPKKKARNAKGSAKMVWANLSRERYDRIGEK